MFVASQGEEQDRAFNRSRRPALEARWGRRFDLVPDHDLNLIDQKIGLADARRANDEQKWAVAAQDPIAEFSFGRRAVNVLRAGGAAMNRMKKPCMIFVVAPGTHL